jgi:K+-sensing histidine kinase KdpD
MNRSDELLHLRRRVRDLSELLARERGRTRSLTAALDAESRLVAGVAHDVRAALNGVLGWMELLQREPLPTFSRLQTYALVSAFVTRHVTMVDEAFDIAATEHGAPFQMRPVAAEDLVGAALAEATALRAGGRVCLDEKSFSDVTLLADRRRLVHALAVLVATTGCREPGGDAIDVCYGDEEDGLVVRLRALSRCEPNVPSAEAVSARRMIEAHGGVVRCGRAAASGRSVIDVKLPTLAETAA